MFRNIALATPQTSFFALIWCPTKKKKIQIVLTAFRLVRTRPRRRMDGVAFFSMVPCRFWSFSRTRWFRADLPLKPDPGTTSKATTRQPSSNRVLIVRLCTQRQDEPRQLPAPFITSSLHPAYCDRHIHGCASLKLEYMTDVFALLPVSPRPHAESVNLWRQDPNFLHSWDKQTAVEALGGPLPLQLSPLIEVQVPKADGYPWQQGNRTARVRNMTEKGGLVPL